MTGDPFRASAIEGAFAIVEYQTTHDEQDAGAAITAIRSVNASASQFDYSTARNVLANVGTDPFRTTENWRADRRSALLKLVAVYRPAWAGALPYGRLRTLAAMPETAKQCFYSCGLTASPPDPEVVAWWDAAAALERDAKGDHLLALGRRGEQLTIDYERDMLIRHGFSNTQVDWVAIDDNSAGFDISSWRRHATGEEFEIAIEVKAFARLPRFYLTRREWREASRRGDRYIIHVWNLSTQSLTELSVDDIRKSVPVDGNGGTWEVAEISYTTLSAQTQKASAPQLIGMAGP